MLNLFKKIFLVIFCTQLLLGVTGCSKHNFINGNIFKPTHNAKADEKTSNIEIIEFDNGVVVYKDKESRKVPSEYRDHDISPASSDVNFGPNDIRFAPADVNPK